MLDEPEVIRILTKLAGIEDKHKKKSKAVLYNIAEEEKAHLAVLGNLMEANSNE